MEYDFLNRHIEIPLANENAIGQGNFLFLCTLGEYNSPCAADDFRRWTGIKEVFVIPGGLGRIQTDDIFGMREIVVKHLEIDGVVISAIEDAGMLLQVEIRKRYSTRVQNINFQNIFQLKTNGIMTKDEADKILSLV